MAAVSYTHLDVYKRQVVIPMQYFDLVALSVTEGKQARSEGVQIEAFLDKRS